MEDDGKMRCYKKLLGCLLFIVILLFSGCIGIVSSMNNDYIYPLPNDYEIWMLNLRQIEFVLRINDNEAHPVLADYILAFEHNNRYVGLKALANPEWEQNSPTPLNQEDSCYYLFDTEERILYGPYASEREYFIAKDELLFETIDQWIPTYPMPKGADKSP